MFENLPQLSQAVREAITQDAHQFAELEPAEELSQVEAELEELRSVNLWIANAIDAIIYPFRDIEEDLADKDEEVRQFWQSVGPGTKALIVEGVLMLLRMIDRELWVKNMERCSKTQ